MIKKLSFIFIILFVFSFLLSANTLSSRHSLSILNYTSTRSRGMMNSTFLIGNDSSALFVNSASLMGLIRDSININYTLSPDFKNEYIFNASYSHTGNSYAIGLGFASEINKIQSYDTLGNKKDNIYNGIYLANIAFAYAINDKSFIGGNIKGVLNNSLNKNIFGGFLDVYYMQSIFTPVFKIGAGIRNFGFYNNVFANIDTDIVASVAYAKEDSTVSVSLTYSVGVPSITHNISLGLEAMIIDFNKLGLFNKSSSSSWYDDLPESVLDEPSAMQKRRSAKLPSGVLARLGIGNNGVSLGLSLYIDLFRLDYAIIFDEFNKNNISHDFGLSFMF